ncbi:MAG: EamA family transporter [Candidatus Moranbacteria bacterium]|nr:EamA family transporter [Candidatus Moranbacteria bacterium]
MLWIVLAFNAALFQALGAAIKKKSLQVSGMNNIIGFVSFLTAGIIFGAFFLAKTGRVVPHLSLTPEFYVAMACYAGLNIVASWFMYRALDLAEFNHLMPFITLTNLLIVIPPISLLYETPSVSGLVGITVIVVGALMMDLGKRDLVGAENELRKQNNRKGVLYFLGTAACYTITPTVAKITVLHSSVLFASFLVHILIGLGFLAMILFAREQRTMKELFLRSEKRGLLVGILLAGFAVALQNGSLNWALSLAPVASVMALYRTMPFFAFLIGVAYFKERTDLKRKILATAIMVAGAVIVALN